MRKIGNYFFNLPEATHSPPSKSNEDKTVIPLAQRFGGSEHKDTVKVEPEPVIVPQKGTSRDKPTENVYPVRVKPPKPPKPPEPALSSCHC